LSPVKIDYFGKESKIDKIGHFAVPYFSLTTYFKLEKMRISDKKINRITQNILDLIQSDKNVKVLADKLTLEAVIKSVIMADLKEEDLIEEEAKRLLDQHANIIAGGNMDYQSLLNKTKRQIARQKGFIL